MIRLNLNTMGVTPFIDYINEQKLPFDKAAAEQISSYAKVYVLVGDKPYKLGFIDLTQTSNFE